VIVVIFVSNWWSNNGDYFKGAKGFRVGNFKSSYLGIGVELQEVGINAWINEFVVFWNRWNTIDDMIGDQINRLLIAHGDALRFYRGFRQGNVLSSLDFAWHSLWWVSCWLSEVCYYIRQIGGLWHDTHDEE
jgi:hypothetical protein